MKFTQKAAFAQGTYQNLTLQWSLFVEFCKTHKVEQMPIDADTICLYAQFLANRMKAPQTVKNYINGVRVLQMLYEQPLGAFHSPELKLTLRGIARLKQHHVHQAQAITLEMLKGMAAHVDFKSPQDIAIWAAILLAFFCLLRKSNYVPISGDAFDAEKQLCRRDIIIGTNCLLVHIKWSKTIQFAQRALVIPVLAIPNSPLCAVEAYKNVVKMVKANPSDPAFSVPGTRRRPVPLTYSIFQNRLKELVHLAGWDSDLFSSHSLRRGGASLAFKAKVPGEMIKVQGDWASDAYLQYLSIPLHQRVQVAAKVRDAVVKC